MLEARRKGGSASTEALAREKDLRQQAASLSLIANETKSCPQCRMGITKTSGCNKMSCTYCSAKFCWLCEMDISEAGYRHFSPESASACAGALFDGVEQAGGGMYAQLQRPLVQEQGAAGAGGAVGAGAGGQVHYEQQARARCPSCGQENWRMGRNNHIRCWACTGHFCYCCRLTIKGTSHFSRKSTCKQHG